MGEQLKFDAKRISDQKRLVRGEQLLAARSALRARDEQHHRRWKLLVMAGGSPHGEVAAIRELMPKAHIVSVDDNPACLDAAIDAGVDDVVQCNLTDWKLIESSVRRPQDAPRVRKAPAASVENHAPFDLINLDLCGVVNETTRDIFRVYKTLLSSGGVVLLTFSYGRDVTEMFIQALADFKHGGYRESTSQQDRRALVMERMQAAGVPELLRGRLAYLFTPTELERIGSIMLYRGNEMPMCSVFFASGGKHRGMSFVQIEHGDYELAVVYPDAANLYDCPKERIESLRRQFAAIKASITRVQQKTIPAALFEVQGSR